MLSVVRRRVLQKGGWPLLASDDYWDMDDETSSSPLGIRWDLYCNCEGILYLYMHSYVCHVGPHLVVLKEPR